VDLEGQTVHDRYLVEALIGEGGDAFVYRAYDRELGRPVALKLLRPELRADPTFVTRFEREAQSAARLNHPHIVPVYDYGEAAGTYFLVMEYVPGGDLRARLRPGQPLPLAFAVRLATEVADALAVAHAHGIVHRDIKPANILLDERDRARVTDFGIAKMLDVPALTATAALLGTPHYLAPEQATGVPITPATDVYALGVVLYEMLAGRRPFEGESFVQVAMQHLHAEPPPLAAPAVPAPLAALVRRALAKDPAARFPDGAALVAALAEQARALGVEVAFAAPRPAPAPAPAVTPSPPAAVAAGPTSRPPAGRPRLPGDVLRAAVTRLRAVGARQSTRRPPRPARAGRPGPVALLSVALAVLAVGFAAGRLLLGGAATPAASLAESTPASAPPPLPAEGLPVAPPLAQPPAEAPTPIPAGPPAVTPAESRPEPPERHAARPLPALEPPPTAAPPPEPAPAPTPAPPARQPAGAAPVVARAEPAEPLAPPPAPPAEALPAAAPAPSVEAPPAAPLVPAPPPPAPSPRPSAPAPTESPPPAPPPPAPGPPVARPAPPTPTTGPPAVARLGRGHGENPPGRQRAPAPVPQAPYGYPPSYPPPWVPPYGPLPPFGVWPGPPPMGPPGFIPPGPAPIPAVPGVPDGVPAPRP
jgi:serine/threonine-protein kinase